MNSIRIYLSLACLLPALLQADWPQAAGPHNSYVVEGKAATSFSASTNTGIRWRTPLPNTGESTPIIANGRIFLTCHKEMTADQQPGQEIYGMCFDAGTGKELWRRELPATRSTDMASGFSDNTAASAVTDGTHVCFVNIGGSIHVYDFSGTLKWKRDWVPFGRHHARQQEPILHDGKVIFLRTIATDLPASATTKAGAKPFGRDPTYWTRLHALDLATGETAWVAEPGTSVHAASMLGRTADGTPAIATGRGGGHQPPEVPYGMSLLNADTGKNIWEIPIKGYAAHQNCTWNGTVATAFVGNQHHLINAKTGKLQKGVSLTDNVRITQYQNGRYQTRENTRLPADKKNKAITYQTNCIVGNYHYFRTHSVFFIGRVNLTTGAVEYLQVPVQVVHENGVKTLLWDGARDNEVKNNKGFIVYQDKRAKLHGWGHVSAASPIVVGDYLYMPTMVGTVYVLAWNAPILNESALVSINDLGPAGNTWSLSSMAYNQGHLYARTLKELICIAPPGNALPKE